METRVKPLNDYLILSSRPEETMNGIGKALTPYPALGISIGDTVLFIPGNNAYEFRVGDVDYIAIKQEAAVAFIS